jgi:hypothetical protein
MDQETESNLEDYVCLSIAAGEIVLNNIAAKPGAPVKVYLE